MLALRCKRANFMASLKRCTALSLLEKEKAGALLKKHACVFGGREAASFLFQNQMGTFEDIFSLVYFDTKISSSCILWLLILCHLKMRIIVLFLYQGICPLTLIIMVCVCVQIE